MKRFLSIAGVIVFFIVIVGLVLLKLFVFKQKDTSAPLTNENPFKELSGNDIQLQTSNPTASAISCFSWYVREYMSSNTPDTVISESRASQCFTQSFIASWDSTINQEEINPLLRTVDFAPTWINSITAHTIGQSIRSSDQEVVLGTGEDEYHLVAHLLEQEDGSWKIDSVSVPN